MHVEGLGREARMKEPSAAPRLPWSSREAPWDRHFLGATTWPWVLTQETHWVPGHHLPGIAVALRGWMGKLSRQGLSGLLPGPETHFAGPSRAWMPETERGAKSRGDLRSILLD